MKAINICLMSNGQTEAAFNFYRSIFGGEFSALQRMKEIPGSPPMPAGDMDKILYMSLPIPNGILMGMDIPSHMPPAIQGNSFMVSIDAASKEENIQLFNSLGEGGSIMMPLGDQFWGSFFGMVKDKFGIQWMLSYGG